ncbi:hypothetical protein AX16_003367 [Volvariella volvacea WC 439]|nr:hypothetical protein AX16_003367 [Volvariella volvacea WC 439]
MVVPAPLTFLDLVDICDNVRIHRSQDGRVSAVSPKSNSPFDSEVLIPLYLDPSPKSPVIGLLRPDMYKQLICENVRSVEDGTPELWFISEEEPKRWVSFAKWVDTPSKRTEAMRELCERWRDCELFEDVCGPKKWRNENYPVYKDPFGVHDYPHDDVDEKTLNYAFEMERSACALFGVVTYGVHMSIYEFVPGEQAIKLWVPTRARTKPTWPGYLDNTVAGGIPSGMSAYESLVKECMEEASIPDALARKYIRCVGAVSYFFRTSAGWLQPEIEYIYDVIIPDNLNDAAGLVPRPLDGEVECFEFLDQQEVILRMRAGRFKPNCAVVLIDLFIRLGFVTPENEPDYMNIVTRLHGRFDYKLW